MTISHYRVWSKTISNRDSAHASRREPVETSSEASKASPVKLEKPKKTIRTGASRKVSGTKQLLSINQRQTGSCATWQAALGLAFDRGSRTRVTRAREQINKSIEIAVARSVPLSLRCFTRSREEIKRFHASTWMNFSPGWESVADRAPYGKSVRCYRSVDRYALRPGANEVAETNLPQIPRELRYRDLHRSVSQKIK